MPLGGNKRNTFGVSLSTAAASALHLAAEELKIRPTTLAAQLLERALQDRQYLPVAKPALKAPASDADATVLAALRALQEEVRALGSERRAAGKSVEPAPVRREEGRGAEVLTAVRSLQTTLRAFRRQHFNATLKLLTTAGHLTADQASQFAKTHLSD
jgi:hypothetical protein